jgi:hypothetical protein
MSAFFVRQRLWQSNTSREVPEEPPKVAWYATAQTYKWCHAKTLELTPYKNDSDTALSQFSRAPQKITR